MKILYIHQYFSSPKTTVGSRSYYISQELLRQGHSVTMLTMDRKKGGQSQRTIIDGIEVIYMTGSYNQSMSIAQRVVSFLRFMLKSTVIAFREREIDLVIATSTPLTVGFPALMLKKFKNIPFVFEVRDLWPEVPIQMGGLKNKYLIRLVEWFEKSIYKNAIHVIALSPGMMEGVVKRNIPEAKVSMIPNMSKIDVFWSREKDKALIQKLGLREHTFKVVYFGSMGLANGMDYIIDAIIPLKGEKDIEFLFIGSGATQPHLKKRCQEEGIGNVHFFGYFASRELSEIVNLCDISLVTFSNLPILATNSPQKLFDSLSAGKPVVVNSPGWTKALVEEYECGRYVDPANPGELSATIRYLKDHPDECGKMGKNARLLAETRYDKSILCREFSEVIGSLSPKILSKAY